MLSVDAIQLKLAMGFMQLVEIFQLYIKLRFILLQKNQSRLKNTKLWLFLMMFMCILLSLAPLPIFDILSRKDF